jgi:hypothetical protein
MTHSYVLIILPIYDPEPSGLQHFLLLLVLRLPIGHFDQLIDVVRPKLHLVYLPVQHQTLVQ